MDIVLYILDENKVVTDTAFFCDIDNAVAYAKKSVRPNERYVIVSTPKNDKRL